METFKDFQRLSKTCGHPVNDTVFSESSQFCKDIFMFSTTRSGGNRKLKSR